MTQEPEGPSKADLEEQVAVESAKRVAKKAAQSRPSEDAAGQVSVVMRAAARGSKAGAKRMVSQETADRLVRQGHAFLA